MSSPLPSVHPHLQRYLPGHLPKRQKRVLVGKTNAREFESSISLAVDSNVARRLGLPDKIAQTMVPSITVTRAADTVTRGRSGEGFSGTFVTYFSTTNGNIRTDTGSCSASGIKGNSTAAHTHQVTLESLIMSNNTGKENGFTAETFYFGSQKIGGAGQREFNNPKEQFGRNPAVSAYQTREHFSPTTWATAVSTHENPPLYTKFGYARRSIHESDSDECILPACRTPSKREERETGRKCEYSYTPKWVKEYVPPNVSDVPPPKLRFELTDYHSTFHHTQPQITASHYVSERDRHVPINKVQLYTPTTAALRKPARRQIASPQRS